MKTLLIIAAFILIVGIVFVFLFRIGGIWIRLVNLPVVGPFFGTLGVALFPKTHKATAFGFVWVPPE